ncbi:MAG: isochorismate synthase [Nitrospiraceae bacterium]|nr:isochorismate synthase [Nitrospiraceae bacterium]
MGSITQALEAEHPAPCLVRAEAPIPRMNAVAWLRAQRGGEKTYWFDRERSFEMAGIGAAHCVTGAGRLDYAALFGELRAALSHAHPEARYYGGMRFDDLAPADPRWRMFGAHRFVAPRFEVLTQGGECVLACNAYWRGGEAIEAELGEIQRAFETLALPPPPAPIALPALDSRSDSPGREEWDRLVAHVLDGIEAGEMEKVVLARQSEFQFSGDLDPIDLLARLAENAADAFLFCFQPNGGPAFLGASPERLFKRTGARILSEALAGTRPRGNSEQEDAELSDELLHSDKDLREHRFVMDCIARAFSALCTDVHTDDALSLVKLSSCQHLVCHYEGTLAEGRCDADVLEALHPTPAVGGHSVQAALTCIRELEPFDRGWYAGPVGWVGADSSEFAIAIRSGLVDGLGLYCYSGAGIVAGATAEQEWREIETKMRAFQRVVANDD